MARPNIPELLTDIRRHGEADRKKLHHAFYYHNQGWMVLPEHEIHVLEQCLAEMNAYEHDEYLSDLRPPEDY